MFKEEMVALLVWNVAGLNVVKNKKGNTMQLKFKKLSEDAEIPQYQTPGSAGFDFHAIESMDIQPGSQGVVKTGLACVIPNGYQVEVRPRSGLAFKHSITVTNSPGTIDSDYRGEIMVILFNLGKKIFQVRKGDRIAQGVFIQAPQAKIVEIEDFNDNEKERDRGGGLGSTGQ